MAPLDLKQNPSSGCSQSPAKYGWLFRWFMDFRVRKRELWCVKPRREAFSGEGPEAQIGSEIHQGPTLSFWMLRWLSVYEFLSSALVSFLCSFKILLPPVGFVGFPGGSDGKEFTCNAADPSSIPGSWRSPGEGNAYPLQYSCLENPMDRGAWQGYSPQCCKESDTTEQLTISLPVGIMYLKLVVSNVGMNKN